VPQGFVYILVSANSNYIKIGGTENLDERLNAINATEPYGEFGPWQLSDFLHVTDWQLVESGLHRYFQERQVRDVPGTRELFTVPPHEARTRLRGTDPQLRVDHEKTTRLFTNLDLKLYLFRLFQLSGLFGNLDIQGAWTLSVLPSTKGSGRWFTLNVGPHEVAFSTRKAVNDRFLHCLILDRLILDYPGTIMWIGKTEGDVREAHYASAKHAVIISFCEDFANAEKVFKLPGVRRALAAYWSEGLADLRERRVKSTYARFHSYDAVSDLLEYGYTTEKMRGS